MDNETFRQTYRDINERFCPYEKTILTNNGACSRAERFCIAEREGVHCRSDAAQDRCLRFLDILRQQARFALRAALGAGALPHAKAMRIQVGGLRGLHAVLKPDRPIPHPIPDVNALVQGSEERFGDLGELPFQVIVQQIAAYKGRRPFRDRRGR